MASRRWPRDGKATGGLERHFCVGGSQVDTLWKYLGASLWDAEIKEKAVQVESTNYPVCCGHLARRHNWYWKQQL